MSVVVTVAAVGAVTVASPVFSGVVAAAAAAIGLRAVGAAVAAGEADRRIAEEAECAGQAASAMEEIEVSAARGAALSEVVAERCELHFTDDRIEVTVSRDIRGKLTVRAHGRGVSRAEVSERADKLLGLIQQQLAYRAVMKTLKQHGFAVESEQRLDDGTARVRVRRGRS